MDLSRSEWNDRLFHALSNGSTKEENRAVGNEVGVRTLTRAEERRDENGDEECGCPAQGTHER